MARVLTFVVLLTLGSPAVAHACSCVGMTQTSAAQRRRELSRQVAGSDAVFLGQVTARNAGWTEFRVVRVWKGSLGSSAVLSTGREPETGGLIVCEREVLLLVLSHLEIGNDLVIVADPSLPESARKVLSDLGQVLHPHQVGTERFELPPNHLLVKTLQLQAKTAFVEVTLGPVPRHATLACGTGYRVKLLAAERGWRIVETTVIEC